MRLAIYYLQFMQKIHRRKNEQIEKEFVCTEGCGKAYGSYAALYTHVKNKHANAKPPEMKSGSVKVREDAPKRVKILQKQKDESMEFFYPYDCRVCKKVQCICAENINHQQLERTISLMGDQTFIKFVSSIGQLQFNEQFNWIRSTEQPFEYLSRDRLREMVYEFNMKYLGQNHSNIALSAKWLEYLSYASRYWDRKLLIELYTGIFIIMSKENSKDIQQALESPEFQNLKKCSQTHNQEWSEFIQFVKAI